MRARLGRGFARSRDPSFADGLIVQLVAIGDVWANVLVRTESGRERYVSPHWLEPRDEEAVQLVSAARAARRMIDNPWEE